MSTDHMFSAMEYPTFVSAILLIFSFIQHPSDAAPVRSLAAESIVGESSPQDDMDHVHSQYVRSNDQLSNHYVTHPGLQQFEMYKRQTRKAVPKSCNVNDIDSYPVPPTEADSSLVCPYTFECKESEDNNTYPPVFFEAKCTYDKDFLFKVYSCKESTYPVTMLKKSNQTGDDGSAIWTPYEREIKTACVAHGAKRGQTEIAETYKKLYCSLGLKNMTFCA